MGHHWPDAAAVTANRMRRLLDTIDDEKAIQDLIQWYRKATPAQYRKGRRWYPQAHHVARLMAEKHNRHMFQVAGAIAALSVMVRWESCLKQATKLLTTGHAAHLTFCVRRAKACLLAGHPEEIPAILKGPKTICFYHCIMDPTCHAVTVDRHASAAAVNDVGLAKRLIKNNGNYLHIAGWYREAARRVGELPAVFQAVVWVVYRETVANVQDDGWSQRLRRAI